MRRASAAMGRAWFVVCGLLVWGAGAVAQESAPAQTGIQGTVIDAESAAPLEGATVTLEPVPLGILSSLRPGLPGFLATARRLDTGPTGRYRFDGLSAGSYRIHVTRLGYRSRTIDVHYEAPVDPSVSVGLTVQPVELDPIVVVQRRLQGLSPAGSDSFSESESERVQLERLRQQQYLSTDTRVLSSADLAEAVTLGETDLLRALHRLPGVTADDDWSAEPWIRGGRWDETRVYFDGLPLLDPVHGGGAFTSVSPDIVGSLTFHPGVQPVAGGSTSAGVVHLRSRAASGEEHLSVLGQVSLLSGRLAVERPLGSGSGFTFSARSSYVDRITGADRTIRPEDYVPLRFTDFGGRWDQTLTDDLKLELSGIKTEDEVLGDFAHELKGTRAAWGNSAIRGTLQLDRGGLRTRLTVGHSRYHSRVRLAPYDSMRVDLIEAATSAPLNNELAFDLAELTIAPLPTGTSPPSWEVGFQELSTRVDYEGPAPWPYPGTSNAGSLAERARTSRTAIWGLVRRHITPSVEISTGLRLEIGIPESSGLAESTLAPRIAALWHATPELRVSAGIGRHYQYEQGLAAAGFDMGPALVPTHLWVTAGDDVPAIRSDIATLGAELWLPGGFLASANTYLRRSTGHLTPPIDSGYVRARPPVDDGRVGGGWVTGRARAVGIELGVRKLAGPWTGSLSYSLSDARTSVNGRTFVSPGERPHVLDAGLLLRLGSRVRLGAAYTASSGATITRFYSFRCQADPYPEYCPPPEDAPEVIGFNEAAGRERGPSYASLDLHFETEGTVFALPFGFFLQLRNVLNRDNRAAYDGSVLTCGPVWGVDCTLEDNFEDGMPLFPLLGFWLRL
jgi:hypothetical protein